MKRKGTVKSKNEKPGASAPVVCHHGGWKGHYKRDCWCAGNADSGNGNTNMNAIAQPTALQIKDIKDAMGRLELAAGMSDGGTIVSTSSGNAIRSIMNHSSTPSSESLWANDFIMSMIDTQTRTHNDSIDVLVGNGADESVCPRWFAPHVEIHQCADPKLRTASESHLKHFGEKEASL